MFIHFVNLAYQYDNPYLTKRNSLLYFYLVKHGVTRTCLPFTPAEVPKHFRCRDAHPRGSSLRSGLGLKRD